MEVGTRIDGIFDLYNYFDSVIVTDDKGRIQYYSNMREDLYRPMLKNIIGHTIIELHPELTEDTSSIMQVLKTGQPVYNQLETWYNQDGTSITNLYNTLPLMKDGKIVGAVDISRAVNSGKERPSITLSDEKAELYRSEDIIGNSPAIRKLKESLPQIARTDSSVLIYGETGTGKELFAQALHTSGNRSKKRFVSYNCAAIPATLLEGILFGTVKGGFTGAENRQGLFEIANGGTLFLDEVNSMDLAMQAKLLKAIEEKKVMRVGGTEPVDIDVKIISAMNKDPYECLENGTIREDLFYRLNVVNLRIPPLREREGDIDLLTRHFIYKFNVKQNRRITGLDGETRKIFDSYNWPGNVRELQNVIEGAFNMTGFNQIRKENLPEYLRKAAGHLSGGGSHIYIDSDEEGSLKEKMAQVERSLIADALENSTTVAEAARKLKISKQDMAYTMKKYGLLK